ncbi:hypothetical protein [Hyalangium versicolor]|uniref:hypothetical protein n=1 Tax=Hyalangium versicolor TaxID=2861190 RepID=UPI001CD01092|nr:hypothetical protein [Hyalangium versicolor]
MDSTPHARRRSSPAPWILTAALTVGVLGCSDDEPKCKDEPVKTCVPPDDGGTGDAGTPDSGTPDASIFDPNTQVLLTQIDVYHTRNGIQSSPYNFNTASTQLVPKDGGTAITGTIVEPGRLRFDAPPGSYLVKNVANYYSISWRSVDISARRYGVPGRGSVFFQTPTPTSFNLTGLEPTPDPLSPTASTLRFHSLDIEESGSFDLQQQLGDGQTSLVTTDAQYWSDYGKVPRFDPARGDSAWVVQTVERDAGVEGDGGTPSLYTSLTRAADLNPFAFDGGTLSVQAALQPAPQQTVRFDWRRDEFNALRIASASSPFTSGQVEVYPALKTAQDGWIDYSPSPMLSYSAQPRDAQTPRVKELAYGNPYPATWDAIAMFTSTYAFDVTNPDGSRTYRASESFASTEAVSDLATTPVRPRISLPRNFKVDGIAATTPQLLGSATPLVTWDPPELGTPTSYTLAIYSLEPSNDFLRPVTRFYLGPDDRSVSVPPGILTPGKDYHLQLTAQTSPGGLRPERVWFTLVVPLSGATTSSALFRVQ